MGNSNAPGPADAPSSEKTNHGGATFEQNPLFQAFAGKGQGKCGLAPSNPLESLLQLGAMFKDKGCGKGAHTMPHASNSTAPAPAAAPSSEEATDGRAAFEQSVNDLMEMGLVSDPQVARELLTQHGDISTVVSVLAENE